MGADADFSIVDMNRRAVLTAADMASKTGHTSWEGVEVTAMPVCTIVRGETVMDHGRVVGRPGHGRMLKGAAASEPPMGSAGHAPLSGME